MAIHFCENSKTFYLDGKDISYIFCLDQNYVEHLYFGKKIPQDSLEYSRSGGAALSGGIRHGDWNRYCEHIPTEFSFFGRGDFREPCVLVENSSGSRISELLYHSYEILNHKPRLNGMPSMDGDETLVLHLKDCVTGFGADMYYTVYEDTNVIARRIVYRNDGDEKVVLRRAYSFSMSLPGNEYEVLSLYGAWIHERRMQRIPIHHGVVSIDSKYTSSSAALNPFMAIMSPTATEQQGEVWGVNLVYSSSYVLKAEGTMNGDTLLTGGINDFDFCWHLNPGDTFETPEVVLAYSNEGIGGMSRAYHDAYRNHLIHSKYAKASRPIVMNIWEGLHYDFDTEKLKSIVDDVAELGIDTLVIDDGWYGKSLEGGGSLGDWYVNENKLKGGLKDIIDYAKSKGMRLGLWFEPEIVSATSDFYQKHSDYIVKIPEREPCLGMRRYVLDLTRKEVRDCIVEAVNRILRENEIAYVKWDYNRNVTDAYSLGRNPVEQAEFSHRYALGLYDLLERVVNANPNVLFEGCAAGGSRFDPAMLHFFSQIWTSDNTDADDRVAIQYGTSIVYPLSTMSCHVSSCPNNNTRRVIPWETRTHIAGLGATGYEVKPTDFTDEIKGMVTADIKEYRNCEDLILNGDLYRLENPMESRYFAVAIVAKDKSKAVMVAYRGLDKPGCTPKRIRMQGLAEGKQYYIPELQCSVAGLTLMQVGIPLRLPHADFQSVKYHFEEG